MQPRRDGEGRPAHVVEALLDEGLVLNADIMVPVAGVEPLGIRLCAAPASFEPAARHGPGFPSGTDTETAAWRRTREEGEPPLEDRPGAGRGAEQRLTDWTTDQEPHLTGRLEELVGRCEPRVEITVERPAATAGAPAQGTREANSDGRSPGTLGSPAGQREQQARDAAGELAAMPHARIRRRPLSVAEESDSPLQALRTVRSRLAPAAICDAGEE
ncbi:gas vesicle protein [Streptomyces sp. NPDC013433]|uniref:gas vesicle protein n=1 Tax=Streptomyces sp. NPDC013433 TaxID=3155604 RepID=UPI003452BE74